MTGDPRVLELLEEILDLGRTPEEVCASCPELLPQVRQRWRRLRTLEAQVEQLFPAPASTAAADGPPVLPAGELPQVPGYEVQTVLGRGGVGVVYKAWHLRLKRPVALKMLLAGPYADVEQRERFQREAEAVAGLRHANIVQVHDVGELDGRPYFTMEYVEGGSLARQLAGTPQPARQAAELVATLAGAVQVAHDGGVLHRDLKLANVLLTADGTPKITDFGLARRLEGEAGLTRSGAPMGTPSYMAPEQAQGRAHAMGPAVDVYALGAILYELLTGRPPFKGETATETMLQVVSQEPVPPSRLNAPVPRDPETICLKCLEKEPARRYASAGELAEDLGRFLRYEPIRARRVGWLGRLGRWGRRNPVPAALVSALVVTGVVALVAIVWQWRNAEYARQEAVGARERAEQAGAGERWERYRSNLAAAAAALYLQNGDMARRALAEAPEEHRNWEWQYLHGQLDSARAVLPGVRETDDLRWLPALSPSGTQAATVDADRRTVRLWDVATGTAAGALRGHEGPVHVLAYSPDGKRLATGSDDHTVRVWDPVAGRELAVLRGHDKPVGWLCFSPDGRRILSTGGDRGCLWDAATGRAVAVLAPVRDRNAAFTPDGQRLVVAVGRRVCLWDATAGRQLALTGSHEYDVTDLALSPDGKRVLSHGDHEKTIRLWDGATGHEVAVLRGHTVSPGAFAFSPDGSRLVSGNSYPDTAARLWDAAAGRPIAVLRGHTNTVRSVAFNPDGRHIVSASLDQTVRLWDGETGRPGPSLHGHTGSLAGALFSPDGTRVVTCSLDQTLRLWDAASGDLVAVLRGHRGDVRGAVFTAGGGVLVSLAGDGEVRVWDMQLAERNGILLGHTSFVYDVAFSPDGTRAASAAWDGAVRVWDVTTGLQTACLQYDRRQADDDIVSSVAWHPGGRQLAAVTRNDRIILWDLATGKPRRVLAAPTGDWTGDCRAVFNPAGTLLAAGSRDGRVRFWDVATGKAVGELRGHHGPAPDVAFNPDGTRLASAGYDRTVRLWDVASRAAVAVLPADESYRVAYSSDGRLVAACSQGGSVRLWDADTHEELAVLPHGNRVLGLAFNPAGDRLATACGDNTVRLWDVASRSEVCELRGHGAYAHAVVFSPDGTRLASASGDRTVRIWDTLPPSVRARGSDTPAAPGAPGVDTPGH
jgi:WD40 repeat protein